MVAQISDLVIAKDILRRMPDRHPHAYLARDLWVGSLQGSILGGERVARESGCALLSDTGKILGYPIRPGDKSGIVVIVSEHGTACDRNGKPYQEVLIP